MDDPQHRCRIRLTRLDRRDGGLHRSYGGGWPAGGARDPEDAPAARGAAPPSEPPERKPPSTTPRRDEETEVIDRPKAQTPRLYKVVFHNDDYTTMEFVILVLRTFFHKSDTEATFIMLTVHKKGSGVAGTYTRDIAETKVAEVTRYARDHGMPLMVTAEPE
jgi:ATP-dependent Clp protease adaptor protein ClpS